MPEATTRKQKVRYRYDALGRRVTRNFGGGRDVTKFTYDGQDVLVDDNFGTQTKYLNGEGIDNKLRATTGSTTSYFLADHLGSTNGLTNPSGAMTASNSYDSFGNPTNTAFSSRYQFTGREFDNFSGLQYSRARFYDPNLGRFISEDPIGLNGGINQYSYVSNNPLNATDPYGMYEIDVHYYLTYYLAMKTGCFSPWQAAEIAEGNQGTDEDPDTAPGYKKSFANSNYHALSPSAFPGSLGPNFPGAVRNLNLRRLGQSLHYYQDTYSHAGYTNPDFGHGAAGHTPDKTNSDVMKAMEMAGGTFGVLKAFGGRMGCKCSNDITPDIVNTTFNFANLPGTPGWVFDEWNTIDSWPSYLDDKRNALGVPPR